MIINALVENKSSDNLVKEWGLCVHIEYQGKYYLLDSGSSGNFQKNADEMGIDISTVNTAILSHAHYDHSGGYDTFFSNNNIAKLYLREGSAENCYAKYGFIKKYVGMPRGLAKRYEERIVYANGTYEIDPGVTLLPHSTQGLEEFGRRGHMYVKDGKRYLPDNFIHEQSLVFETEDGLVILNSCSHAGADNIMMEALTAYPGKRIKAFIGGFHLIKKPKKEIIALAERLKNIDFGHIYTGHCTGDKAYSVLKQILGNKVSYFSTGTKLEL